ncbi:MAG: hypothetical protein ISP90_09730 [Nevskia sp.]|nr:hypothetical protein [Nevskia sp.]
MNRPLAGRVATSVQDNPRAAAFFAGALDEFAEIRAAGRTAAHHYAIAGLVLRIDIACGAMEHSLCRALQHLAIPSVERPDLSLVAWDSASTGSAPLRAAWSIEDYGNYGLIGGFNDVRYYAAAQSDPAVIFGMLDRQAGQALYWTPDAGGLPIWERGAPFRPLLHEWLYHCGLLPVHGGAIGLEGSGVFLAGAGGRGKSNVALGCLAAGLSYVSDDFCVLSDSPQWRAHSLYSTGKLGSGDLVRHPGLVPLVSNPHALAHEKALFFLHEAFAGQFAHHLRLKAIVLPQVVGEGRSDIVPASAAEAQRAVAMSTVRMSGWHGVSTFSQVARFVRALPCFTLRIGADFENIPALIGDLLSRLAALPH